MQEEPAAAAAASGTDLATATATHAKLEEALNFWQTFSVNGFRQQLVSPAAAGRSASIAENECFDWHC